MGLGSIGKDNEPFALMLGIVALISGVFFFLWRFEVIETQFSISDEGFLLFFAGFTVISGVIHLLTTLGIIGKKY